MAISYPYITKNNLENVQHYDYSEFVGREFFDSFYHVRMEYVNKDSGYSKGQKRIINDVEFLAKFPLGQINKTLETLGRELDLELLELLLKSFEIRKRIYDEYQHSGKRLIPVINSSYSNPFNYIFFSYLLCCAYKQYGDLRYLNALLKCNDILCSLRNQNEFSSYCIMHEISFVRQFAERQNVTLDWKIPYEKNIQKTITIQDIALIAAPNQRSEIYLRELLKAGFIPNSVYMIPNDSTKTQEESEERILSFVNRHNIPIYILSSTDINCENTIRLLHNAKEEVFIYSVGGGVILCDALLHGAKRFLHAHAGSLPYFRGSTTAYYELLLHGCISASAIWLAPGIDSGEICAAVSFSLNELKEQKKLSIDYEIEPTIRALAIIEALKKLLNGENVAKPQHARTYYRIHPVLKHLAIIKFLNS